MLVAEIGRVRYARCTGSIGRIRQPLIYASGWVKARLGDKKSPPSTNTRTGPPETAKNPE